MQSKPVLSSLALAAAIALLSSGAQAVGLNKSFSGEPFLDTALPGTTSAARPELAGTVLEDVLQPFAFSGVSGTVQNRVVREDGTGTLDFYWRVVVTAVSTDTRQTGVAAFRLGNFGYNSINDGDWRIDGLGTVAPFVGRVFNPADHPEGAINFLFTDPAVSLGAESRFFFLHTDAKAYGKTAIYDLLSSPSQNLSGLFETFAPAVPEPSTYALLAAGLAGIGFVARRRRS